MSKRRGGSTSKKIRVVLPGVNLSKVLGPRDAEMGEDTAEARTSLEKKQDKLKNLELEEEILEVEERIKRTRKGENVSESSKSDSLGDKMVEQVIIPLVNRKLSEEEKGGEASGVVDRALRIAEKAVGRTSPSREGRTSAMDELDQAINIFTRIKGMIEGDREEREEAGEETTKEVDALAQLDKTIDIVERIQKVFPQEGGGGGGMSERQMEFEKWKIELEAEQKKALRSEALDRRRIDKAHDAKLVELGIEKDRNNLLRDGFKRVGRAVALALGEEEEFEEEEEQPAPAKGRKQLIREKCTECEATILIPPEAQVAGREIKCSKCGATFVWE